MSALVWGFPRLPSPSGSTGCEVISEGTDCDATRSIWTRSTTSSSKGSLRKSEGSRQVGKQRASLVEIVSQITKRNESSLPILEGKLLRQAVESLLLANPRGTLGRLVETAVGPNSSWRLELTVPLSDEDSESWLARLILDRAESPTGDKTQFSNLVHCKYIVRTWTMYLPNPHPVHHRYIQNFPSQFPGSVPGAANAQYIHSVPGCVIKMS